MKFSIYLYRRVFVIVFALIFVLLCCFFNHYIHLRSLYNYLGWLGEAMSCILRHRGVQLLLAYSWARPAILAAGKGRVRNGFIYFVSSLLFICLSPLSLAFTSSTISSISLLPLSGRGHKMTHKGWRDVKPQLNQVLQLLMYYEYLCCQCIRWILWPYTHIIIAIT